MDDGFDQIALGVRIETDGFARDVAELRATLEGQLSSSAANAGRGIEGALSRAARDGKLQFEDLARVAGRALGEIAAAALKLDLGGSGSGGLGGVLSGLAASVLGAPGRATGGPVAPGRAYLVGENGPEYFVPTSSGRVATTGARSATTVNVHVQVRGEQGGGKGHLAMTGSQVARSVRRALERAEI
jgi:phage-related minor tail protein